MVAVAFFFWYQHIRSFHHCEYYSKPASSVTDYEQPSASTTTAISDTQSIDALQSDIADGSHQICSSGYSMSNSDIAAGMMVKLKEECRLPQSAMSEVVKVADFACDHVIQKALAVVEEVGAIHGLNPQSPLVLEISEALQNIQSPFTGLSTTYQQHSYKAQNMPYVVSIYKTL